MSSYISFFLYAFSVISCASIVLTITSMQLIGKLRFKLFENKNWISFILVSPITAKCEIQLVLNECFPLLYFWSHYFLYFTPLPSLSLCNMHFDFFCLIILSILTISKTYCLRSIPEFPKPVLRFLWTFMITCYLSLYHY